MRNRKIPIYKPNVGFREAATAATRILKRSLSGKPNYVAEDERALAEALGVPNLTLVSNGTIALELALRVLGLPKRSQVVVPEVGYVAVFNTVKSLDLEPIICPVDSRSLQINSKSLEEIFMSSSPKGVIVIHNYGLVCNMTEIVELCNKFNVFLIEDCAEAIGSSFLGNPVGTFGDASTFSFFANKIITCGEGGAVVFRDEKNMATARMLKDQSIKSKFQMTSYGIGYNFRMSAILSAILRVQVRRISASLRKKNRIMSWYQKMLRGTEVEFQEAPEGSSTIPWLINLKFDSKNLRDLVALELDSNGIESRLLFPPLDNEFYGEHVSRMATAQSRDIYDTWLSLPSYPSLRKQEVNRICHIILHVLRLNQP
jgi:perosamine synthetase